MLESVLSSIIKTFAHTDSIYFLCKWLFHTKEIVFLWSTVYTALETTQANVPLVRHWYDHMFHSTAVALFHSVVQFRKCRDTVHIHQQPTHYVYTPWVNSMAIYTQLRQGFGSWKHRLLFINFLGGKTRREIFIVTGFSNFYFRIITYSLALWFANNVLK